MQFDHDRPDSGQLDQPLSRSSDATDAITASNTPDALDPTRLYSLTLDPPPSAYELRRHYARRALALALGLEGTITLICLALGRSIALLGLVDGLDEICGCLALIVSAISALLGWSLGALYGNIVYKRELRAWRMRQMADERG